MALPIPNSESLMFDVVEHDNLASLLLTTTERYEDQNSLLCMLDNIGLDTKEKFRLLHDGYNTMEKIVNNYVNKPSDFKKYLIRNNKTWMSSTLPRMRSFFTPIIMDRLVGVLHYVHTSVKLLHIIPCLLQISIDKSDLYGQQYKDSIAEKKEDEDDVDIPKLNESKDWNSFKESFIMKLNLFKGVREIPIDYVIDDTVRQYTRANMLLGEQNIVDIDDESMKTRTVHFGQGFKIDNRTVWNKLKVVLLDKPGYNHISQFNATRNGRAAWKALITYFEGEHYKQHLRETAFQKLQTTFYRGETGRFTFEKYVNIHKSAHKMLQDAQYNSGSGLDNETKVQYFRNGIKYEVGIEVALSNARPNVTYQDFGALLSFLSAEIDHHKIRKAALSNSNNNRRVSKFERKNNNDKSTANNNNNKRNNQGGSGGSLTGVKYQNGIPFKVVDGKRIEGRFYDRDEFRQFTSNQKKVCNQMKTFKNNNNDTSGKSGTDNDRNISATRADMREDMITLGEAMISGVRAASIDNEAGTVITQTTQDSTSNNNSGSKPSGDSGSIGNIFRSRNKRRKNN